MTLNKNVIFSQATGGSTAVNTLLSGPVSVTITGAGTGVVTLNANDTYTGNTTITSGTLQVSNIQNGGIASSLGASTNAASNLIINGGTLEAIGANGTTDRLFSLGTGGNSTIQSDSPGTNGLIFANTGLIEFNGQTGGRTLVLSGNGTTGGNLTSVLGDNGGATALVKTTTGGSNTTSDNWTVSGLNTFSGQVLVHGTRADDHQQPVAGLGSKTITINNNSIHLPTLNLNAPGGSINLPSSFTYSVSHQ